MLLEEQVQEEQATEQTEVETATEQTQETATEETTATEQTSEEQTTDTQTESQASDTETQKEALQTQADDNLIFKLKNKEEEFVYDIRDAEQRKQLEEAARKGLDYTKKTQVLSELEQSLKDQQTKFSNIQNDPDYVRLGIAKQMNINPEVLFHTPQPPNEAMKDWDMTGYIQAYNTWDMATKQKQLIENTFQLLQKQNADSINNAIVKKSRLKYEDLNDQEFNQALQWASQRFQPDKSGVYPDDSLDVAIRQLFGDKKMETEKLKMSNNFNKKIQQAVKSKPVKQVSNRVEKPAKSSESDFVAFVEKSSGATGGKPQSYYD